MPKRYKNIQILQSNNGKSYRSNAVYPDLPPTEQDIYVIATAGDRYDTLANQYYGDSTLWWIISAANPSSDNASLIPVPGTQIRIPGNKQQAINDYSNLNRTR